jgi:hypothetical protein
MLFVDLSGNNSPNVNGRRDFERLRAATVRGALLKATEGATFVNERYRAYRSVTRRPLRPRSILPPKASILSAAARRLMPVDDGAQIGPTERDLRLARTELGDCGRLVLPGTLGLGLAKLGDRLRPGRRDEEAIRRCHTGLRAGSSNRRGLLHRLGSRSGVDEVANLAHGDRQPRQVRRTRRTNLRDDL